MTEFRHVIFSAAAVIAVSAIVAVHAAPQSSASTSSDPENKHSTASVTQPKKAPQTGTMVKEKGTKPDAGCITKDKQ